MLRKIQIICFVFIAALVFVVGVQDVQASVVTLTLNTTHATVDGQDYWLDCAPYEVDGRTLVPVRFISESTGATVSWNDSDQIVTVVSSDGTEIKLKVGNYWAKVNGQEQRLEVYPQFSGERVMVPLRFIVEALGAQVEYDASTGTITLTTSGSTTTPNTCYVTTYKDYNSSTGEFSNPTTEFDMAAVSTKGVQISATFDNPVSGQGQTVVYWMGSSGWVEVWRSDMFTMDQWTGVHTQFFPEGAGFYDYDLLIDGVRVDGEQGTFKVIADSGPTTTGSRSCTITTYGAFNYDTWVGSNKTTNFTLGNTVYAAIDLVPPIEGDWTATIEWWYSDTSGWVLKDSTVNDFSGDGQVVSKYKPDKKGQWDVDIWVNGERVDPSGVGNFSVN